MPQMPVISKKPIMSEMPFMSEMPVMPQMPVMSEMPIISEIPVMSEMSIRSEIPIVSEMPVISEMPIAEAPLSPIPTAVVPSPVVMPVVPDPMLAPEPPMPSVAVPFVGGKHHAQDEFGQYSFSHWGGPNTRVEIRNPVGVVSGSFAYINPNGDIQVRKYAAGPMAGFKVAASDLPVETPEVAEIRSAQAKVMDSVRASQAKAKAISSA